MLNLAAGLERGRAKPELLLLDGQGPLADEVPEDVPVRDLATPRLRRVLPRLLTEIRRRKPDVVLSTFGYVNIALLACRFLLPRGTRVFVRDANLPSLSLPNAAYGRWLSLGYKAFYPRADAILCSSERMMAEFAADYRVPEKKLRLLANPVDVDALRRRAAEPIRDPGNGARFVAAGRLTRQKGFDRLLELFAALPDGPDLTILGDGPDQAALTAKVDELGLAGRVRLAGFEPEPWRYYAGADAFLLPSRWEGMPNAALEALACGTPVIATPDAGGIDEVAREAGSGSVQVIPFGEPFAAAMQAVAPSPLDKSMRPSLLPPRFALPQVCRALETILTEIR